MEYLLVVLLALVLLDRRGLELNVPRADLLEGVQLLSHLLHPAAIDELVDVEAGSTMRTLRPLLCQPSPDAHVAAQLGAVRTEVGVTQLLHADETPEHLSQGLHRVRVPVPCHLRAGRHPTWPWGKCQQLINTQMSDTSCTLDTWDRRGARSIFVSLSHDALRQNSLNV